MSAPHLYRVVVRFRFNRLPFLTERGVLAADRDSALRDVLNAIGANREGIDQLQALVEQVFDLGQFDIDALYHPTVNGDGDNVADAWRRLRARR